MDHFLTLQSFSGSFPSRCGLLMQRPRLHICFFYERQCDALLCVFQEEAAKSVLAEFNLGCDVDHTQHVYRVYVTTFLGFGGNMARQRYEDQLLNVTLTKNR